MVNVADCGGVEDFENKYCDGDGETSVFNITSDKL